MSSNTERHPAEVGATEASSVAPPIGTVCKMEDCDEDVDRYLLIYLYINTTIKKKSLRRDFFRPNLLVFMVLTRKGLQTPMKGEEEDEAMEVPVKAHSGNLCAGHDNADMLSNSQTHLAEAGAAHSATQTEDRDETESRYFSYTV